MNLSLKFSRSDPLRFCTCNRNLVAKDALVGATGMGNENRNDEGTGSGHWSLVMGHWNCEFGVLSVDPGNFFVFILILWLKPALPKAAA